MSKFCSNCGKEVDDKAVVCVSCGASLQEEKVVKDPNAKSKLAAGLLGIFLGSFGVHNFYLGYTGKAVAQLLISVLTCGFGAVISGIWGLIEGIFILTGEIKVDANGKPLSD
ncbi:MAG: TM2 domain-containing protein [Bacilli bacterium]